MAEMDLQQIVGQVLGNADLLKQLKGLAPDDAGAAKDAVRASGISISSSQVAGLMSMLQKVDFGAALRGVDLSDGFDMKDVQGALGALFGTR